MKRPRFRIAWIMIAVSIAALDFAAIRVVDPSTPQSSVLGFGVLPMANVLAVGLLMTYGSHGSRGFLFGFEVFGAMALSAYIAVAIMFPYEVIKYIHLGTRPYEKAVAGSPYGTLHLVIAYAIGTAMLFLPQVAFALLGGFLSRKFRIAERSGRTHC